MVILYPSYDIILSDDQLINQCKGSVNSGSPFIFNILICKNLFLCGILDTRMLQEESISFNC